jgi:hypothetical protein
MPALGQAVGNDESRKGQAMPDREATPYEQLFGETAFDRRAV